MMRTALMAMLLATSAVGGSAATCDAASGPVSCETCASGADVNGVSHLPRITRKGTVVSSNLAAYDLLSCPGNNQTCTIDASSLVGGDLVAKLQAGPTAPTDVMSYLEGVLGYAVFGFIAALVCVLYGLSFCCGRCCCCCIRGGCCGKRYPTYASQGCCRTGFREVPAPLLSKGGVVELGYTPCARWSVRIMMLGYIAAVAGFVAVGQLRGNLALTTSMHSIAASPAGLIKSALSIQTPLTNALINVAADSLHPLLTDLNATISSAVDVHEVVSNVQCVSDGIRTALPDPSTLLAFVGGAQATLATLTTSATQFQGNLTSVQTSLASVSGAAGVLAANLTGLYTSTGNLNGSISSTAASLAAMQASITALNDSTSGLPATTAELVAISTNLPSTAAASALASGTGSLTSLLAHSMDGNAGVSNRASLRASMVSFNAALGQLPNMTVVGQHLQYINGQVATLRSAHTVDALSAGLTGIQQSLAALPPTAVLNASVNAVVDTLRAIDVSGLSSTIRGLNTTIAAGLPNVTVVLVEIDKLRSIDGVLTCMASLVAQARALNATVVQLPQQFNEVSGMLDAANDTYRSALSMVDGFRSQLTSLGNYTGNLPNLTAALVMVDALQAQMASPVVDTSAINAALQSADTARTGVNVTALISALTPVNASIWDPDLTVSTSSINALMTLQSTVEGMNATVAAAIKDLDLYSNSRRCQGTTTVCTTDASTAAPCSGGAPCEGATATCTLDASTPCSADSDCTGGKGTCPFQQATFQAAFAAVNGYAASNPDSFKTTTISPASTAMNAAAAAVNAAPPIPALQSSLASLQSALGAVPINSSIGAVAALDDQVGPHGMDLAPINASVNAVLATLASVDLTTITSALQSFNSSISTVKQQADAALTTAAAAARGMETLFFTTLPAQLPRMTRTSLNTARTAGGLPAVVRQLTGVAQDTLDALNGTIVAMGMTNPAASFNLTDMTQQYMGYLDTLANANSSAYGPGYFVALLMKADVVSPTEYAAVGGGTVFKKASGQPWAGGRRCLLADCISATIYHLNQDPLAVDANMLSLAATGGTPAWSFSLPLSRELLMFLPFLAPIAIIAIGFIGAGFCCGKRWQRCPACFSGTLICFALPLIFIFAVGIGFPLVMVAADTCRSGFNIAHAFISGSEAAVCAYLPSGTIISSPDGAMCATTIMNTTMSFKIAKSFRALAGDCGTYSTVMDDTFAQAAKLGAYPSRYLNDTLDDLLAGGGGGGALGIAPRPPVITVAKALGRNLQRNVEDAASDMASTLTCDTVHRNIDDLTSPFCCDLMTSVYWFVSSWCFIAFCMCLCGFPASVLGYKRLPAQVWGPERDARLAAGRDPGTGDAVKVDKAAKEEQAAIDSSLVAKPEGDKKGDGAGGGGGPASPKASARASEPAEPLQPNEHAAPTSIIAVSERVHAAPTAPSASVEHGAGSAVHPYGTSVPGHGHQPSGFVVAAAPSPAFYAAPVIGQYPTMTPVYAASSPALQPAQRLSMVGSTGMLPMAAGQRYSMNPGAAIVPVPGAAISPYHHSTISPPVMHTQ